MKQQNNDCLIFAREAGSKVKSLKKYAKSKGLIPVDVLTLVSNEDDHTETLKAYLKEHRDYKVIVCEKISDISISNLKLGKLFRYCKKHHVRIFVSNVKENSPTWILEDDSLVYEDQHFESEVYANWALENDFKDVYLEFYKQLTMLPCLYNNCQQALLEHNYTALGTEIKEIEGYIKDWVDDGVDEEGLFGVYKELICRSLLNYTRTMHEKLQRMGYEDEDDDMEDDVEYIEVDESAA